MTRLAVRARRRPAAPHRAARAAAGLMLAAVLWIAPALARADDPRSSEPAWIVTLEWSPQFCKTHPGNRDPQCEREHFFVLSRLQKLQPSSDCSADELAPEVIEQTLLEIPSRRLIRDMWRVDGRCSGLAPDQYMIGASRVRRKITVPPPLRELRERMRIDAGGLTDAFMQHNPQLPAGGIVARCDGSHLAEMRFCFDAAFEFADCRDRIRTDCAGELTVRGTPEGRRSRAR